MKRGVILFFTVFLVQLMVTAILSCKKGSGILGPGYVRPTPTATFTPDINYSVYIHQQGTPVQGLELTLKNSNATLQTATDNKGIGGFKVNEYGQWSLLIDTFDDFSPQSFLVEPVSNTFFAIDYGIPTLELNLVSGKEEIPVHPSSITYTVKYRTKFERKKYVLFNCPEGINPIISYPHTVANDGDELTIRLDIKKSFEGYNINKKYLNIYAYTQGVSPDQKTTTSNVRTLTKNWTFNVTADYYYIALYNCATDNGYVSFYSGIKNTNVSLSYNIPFIGQLHYEISSCGNTGTAGNISQFATYTSCMPDFTDYGCFDIMGKIKTTKNRDYAWKYSDNNGWLEVRFYDDGYLDLKRYFSTNNDWGQVCWYDASVFAGPCARMSVMLCNNSGLLAISPVIIFRHRYETINITE